MKRFVQFICPLFWVVSLSIPVMAAADEDEMRTFRVLGYGEGLFDAIFFELPSEEGEVQVAVGFLPDQRSRRYRVPAPLEEVRFYRWASNPGGESEKREVGAFRFGEQQEAALLVFLEPAEFAESARYEILNLDESPSVWSAGSLRFLNLSGADLNSRLGENRFVLGSGEVELYRFDTSVKKALPLVLSLPWRGREQTVFSTRVVPDPKFPKLLVIKPPLEEESLKVRVDTLW